MTEKSKDVAVRRRMSRRTKAWALASVLAAGAIIAAGCTGDSAIAPADVAGRKISDSPDVVSSGANRAEKVGKSATVGGGVADVGRLAAVRKLAKDSIASWNRALDRVAASSKRGEGAVSLRRQVLRALGASNDAAFHSEVAKLRISWVDSAGRNKNGVVGFYRQYFVDGAPRTQTFFPSRVGKSASSLMNQDAFSVSANSSDERRTSGPSADTEENDILPHEYTQPACEYAGQPDECATQQDIDDLASLIAAIDIEIAGQEQTIATGGGCDKPCEYETEMDGTLNGAEYQSGGPFVSDAESPESPDGYPATKPFGPIRTDAVPCSAPPALDPFSSDGRFRGAALADCTQDAIQAGIAVVSWVGAKVAGYELVMAAGAAMPAATTVAFTVFGVMTTGWAAAVSLNSYWNCRQSNLPH